MQALLTARRLKAELDALRPLDADIEAMVMQKFRLDWNFHSNNLEGNTLSYGETKALLLFGLTAQGKPLKDHMEIQGHNEAVNWILDVMKGEMPLTEHFIRELHTLILKAPYQTDAITPDGKPVKKDIRIGAYKSLPNHVQTRTGEVFRFASPEETPAKMHDLVAWYRETVENGETNPILLAGEFHYRFVRIHPFDDGNGRCARLLMNFILMRFGYPPVIIKTQDKARYLSALELADSGQINVFLEYVAQNLTQSLNLMLAAARGESIEEPDDLDKEIALLAAQLNLSKPENALKTYEIIREMFEQSFLRLSQTFERQCKKFEKLYFEVTPQFGRLSSDNIYISSWQSMIEHISRHEQTTMIIKCLFNNIKDTKLFPFAFDSSITIEFNNFGYFVSTPEYPNMVEKLYPEQLTNAEIDRVVKLEMKRHTEALKTLTQNKAE